MSLVIGFMMIWNGLSRELPGSTGARLVDARVPVYRGDALTKRR
ncbi:MAG: hypothetical protein Ct9H300mP32_1390 [Verrucomicrobiota bacterium]|nr:MAG: hypothetical protein Ct9H300mP32_1390 [Verrucomicrobiota bacterium]